MASDRAYSRLASGGWEWDIDHLNELGFKKGSVLRVSMKNFLTYDSSEVFPGPRLNVVLGPNGTGKSTITHAICLACCGGPQTVGRSPDLLQFIKHGKEEEECYVEVDLFREPLGEGDVVRIRRTIQKGSAGKWSVDEKKTTEAAVKEIMKELKIDVDNLCSFMPQDKVGNFSQQTPQGILQKTLESITSIDEQGKNLHEIQKELGELQVNKDLFSSRLEAKKKVLSKLEDDIEQMQGDVDRIRARQANQEMLDMLKFRLVQLESAKQKDLVTELNNNLEDANEQLSAKQNSIAPIQTYERNAKKQVVTHEKAAEELINKIQKCDADLKNQKKLAAQFEEELISATADLKNSAANRVGLQKSCAARKTQISKLEKDLQSAIDNLPRVEASLKSFSEDVKAKTDQSIALDDQMQDVQDSLRRVEDELRAIDRQVKNVKDPYLTFRNRLASDSWNDRDVKFMDYFRSHRDKMNFEKEVYGPIALHLNFKDPIVAAIVEDALPKGKQLGYIVQTINDDKKLREMNNDINIFTILNANQQPRFYTAAALRGSNFPGEMGFLTDEIQCPPVVKAFLHDLGGLNNHLLVKTRGRELISDNHLENLVPANGNAKYFNLYVHNSDGRGPGTLEKHNGSRSRYNNASLSLSSSTLNPNARFLQSEADDGGESVHVAAELERKREGLMSERKDLQGELKKIQREKADVVDSIGTLKDALKKLNADKSSRTRIESNIAKLKVELKQDEDALAKDPAVENRKLLKQRENKVNEILRCADKMTQLILERIDLDSQLVVENEALKLLRDAVGEAHDLLADAKQELEALRNTQKTAERLRNEAKVKLDSCTQKLEELRLEHGSGNSFREYFKAALEATKAYPDIDSIEARIHILQTQIEATVDNQAVIRNYEKALKDRVTLDAEVQAMTEDELELVRTVEERSQSWVEQVKAVTSKLDVQFSAYMQNLRYDGNVKLVEKGNFDKYEMQMSVQFRKDGVETLTVLSGQRHSGGERAVSTIMYLMALQEMTNAPFRCVDEINQGMDERNERLVFDRIVQSCCSDKNKPQYFLVSPKLLQGLRAMEHDDVTVLIVINGPGVCWKWRFADVVDQIVEGGKKRGRGDQQDGGDLSPRSKR